MTVSLVIAENKDSDDANASFCVPRQKVFRELDVSVTDGPKQNLTIAAAFAFQIRLTKDARPTEYLNG